MVCVIVQFLEQILIWQTNVKIYFETYAYEQVNFVVECFSFPYWVLAFSESSHVKQC
jgi:hypothetical protein